MSDSESLIVEDNNKPLIDKKDSTTTTNNNNTPGQIQPAFTGNRSEEKQMLVDMGFEVDLINTIYKNMNPVDLQEALDFLNKNEKGKFTHSYLVNENNVCTICGKGRSEHESDVLFVENNGRHSLSFSDEGDDDNDFLDDYLIGRTNSNSNRFNAYETTYRNSLGKENSKKNNELKEIQQRECGICFEKIDSPANVALKCGHYFCNDCWTDYLKEKIINANVIKILCMQHGCTTVLDSKFIKNILDGKNDLIEKYDKFLNRKQKLEQSDKFKNCPFPNCEGFAEKTGKSKYVKCNFGHEFCFECGNEPHGKKKCEEMIDKEFEEWRSHKIVKRCPCCRMWTEKNEGCNHMTCVECKFQWCWLCQKPYGPNHFGQGSCKGLQFYKETDQKKVQEKLAENRRRYGEPGKAMEYFCNFGKCVGYLFLLVFFTMVKKFDDLETINCAVVVFYLLAFLPIFISYELFFIVCVIIGSIPFLVYPPFFRRFKFFVIFRLYQF